jgi:hypothetical protein
MAQEQSLTYRDLLVSEAQKHRIPSDLALAIVSQESSGRMQPGLPTPQGQAQGFFQIMPETAKGLGIDPTDPVQNIQGGLRLFSQLLDQTGGNVNRALALYHGGQDLQQHGPRTRAYVEAVLGRWQPPQAPTTGAPQPPARQTTEIRPPALDPVGTPPPPTAEAPRRPRYTGGIEGSRWDPAVKQAEAQTGTPPPSLLQTMAGGFDPRTPEGRRNLAAGAGAAVGVAVTRSPAGARAGATLAPSLLMRAGQAVSRAIPAIAGAGAGGAAAEAVEQVVGTKPPDPGAIGWAAAEQAAYETGGQGVVGLAQAAGRRALAFPVAYRAHEALQTTRRLALDAFDESIHRARTSAAEVAKRVSGTIREVAGQGRQAVRGAVQGAKDRVRGAIEQGLGARQAAVVAGQHAEGAARAPYEALVGAPPPSARMAGQAASDVMRGPAKTTLDTLGEAVQEAANRGPLIPMQAIREKIQQAAQRVTPTIRSQMAAEQSAADLGLGGLSPAARAQVMAELGASPSGLPAGHPLPRLLQELASIPTDTLSFRDAHIYKRALDEAVSWDRAAKKQAEQMSKGVRQTLRTAMATTGYLPYEQATAAYESAIKLYQKGYGRTLAKVGLEEPAALVGKIRPDFPDSARMLRELLVDLSEESGAGAQGQRAWEAVQQAWLHQKVIRGGLEGLEGRLAKLTPDFEREMFGDQVAQTQLANLRQMGPALAAAQAQAKERLASVIGEERAKVLMVRRVGEAEVEAAKQLWESKVAAATSQGAEARAAEAAVLRSLRRDRQIRVGKTAEEQAFEMSSLYPSRLPQRAMEAEADLIRGVVLGPGTFWGAYSWMRLLAGPHGDDLIRWAAYSPESTQSLVRLMTSPVPRLAGVDLLRGLGAPQLLHEAVTPTVGTPPPRP